VQAEEAILAIQEYAKGLDEESPEYRQATAAYEALDRRITQESQEAAEGVEPVEEGQGKGKQPEGLPETPGEPESGKTRAVAPEDSAVAGQVGAAEAARTPVEQAQAAVDAAEGMEAKQAALDKWKSENPEAVEGVSEGRFVGFRGGRTGPFRAELTKPTYRKDEQLGFGIHVAKDESFARLYAEDDRTARRGSQPHIDALEVVMRNPLESRVVVTEGDSLWPLVKALVPKDYHFFTDGGRPIIFLQNAIDAASPKKAERVIREAGYDGVIYDATVRGAIVQGRASVSGESESYVVFDSSQVRPSPLTLGPDGKLAGTEQPRTPTEQAPSAAPDAAETPSAAEPAPTSALADLSDEDLRARAKAVGVKASKGIGRKTIERRVAEAEAERKRLDAVRDRKRRAKEVGVSIEGLSAKRAEIKIGNAQAEK
jgi:hypothetical protein